MKGIISFLNLDNERKLLNISIFLLFALISILLISYYRRFFGVIEGYVPYEFAFNMLFFLPSILFIIVVTFITTLKVKTKWRHYKNVRWKWMTISFLPPVVLFLSYAIIRFFILLMLSTYN